MKIKYVGESFGVDSLTNGKVYEAIEDSGMYRVIDDSGEDYLYSTTNPAPLNKSSKGGKWEIVEEEFDKVKIKKSAVTGKVIDIYHLDNNFIYVVKSDENPLLLFNCRSDELEKL